MDAISAKPCLRCGGHVKAKSPHTHGKQRRFCSDDCRRRHRKDYERHWLKLNRLKVAEYRDENRDQVRAWNRAFYARHRERRKQERVDRYLKNPEPSLATARRYAESNPDKIRAIGRVSSQVRRSRKLNAFVEVVDPVVVFSRDQGVCGICATTVDPESKWEVDHVTPLSKGGKHSYDNVQLAHLRCNRSKGARMSA